jgi:hypothetical protein
MSSGRLIGPQPTTDHHAKSHPSALIVSPTWREIETVTREVRQRLKAEQLLGEQEIAVPAHQALKWTRAQKRDLRNYRSGLVLTFHRGTKDFTPGEWADVVRVDRDTIQVWKSDGRQVQVTKKQAGCFDVAKVVELPVAAGERLLIQGNRKAAGLHNGQMVTVESVEPDGSLRLAGGPRIPRDFRAFTSGYCVTSLHPIRKCYSGENQIGSTILPRQRAVTYQCLLPKQA